MKWEPVEVRFWRKVDVRGPDECWEWTAARGRVHGYGLIGVNQRSQLAHRVSYELNKGPIPEGLAVCHTCDNRGCVNPAHLWVGTWKDNNDDKLLKGRAVILRGEAHGMAKLTEAQVREIRARYAAGGLRHRDLAMAYGVGKSLIGLILQGKVWRHVA